MSFNAFWENEIITKITKFTIICMDITLEPAEDLIRLWLPFPNFQGHSRIR